MVPRVEVFLDTSALFAGIWSLIGGVRLFLKLGEAGAVKIMVRPEVLVEIERSLQSKAPGLLPTLTVLLDRVGVLVTSAASERRQQECFRYTNHLGDAQVVADAWDGGVDYFVTLDRKPLLENQPLREALPYLMGKPGDFLEWYRIRLMKS